MDYDTYFVCKVSKVSLHLSISGKPVAELITVFNNLFTVPTIPVLPQHPKFIIPVYHEILPPPGGEDVLGYPPPGGKFPRKSSTPGGRNS